MDVHERTTALIGKGQLQVFKNCFIAVLALEWLCDFTSIMGRDEPEEMAAHFVWFGLSQLLVINARAPILLSFSLSEGQPAVASQLQYVIGFFIEYHSKCYVRSRVSSVAQPK